MTERRTYVGQATLYVTLSVIRTWWAWAPVVIVTFLLAFLFGVAGTWPRFLMNHEGHQDCTVLSKAQSPHGLVVRVSLSNGATRTNYTADQDYINAGFNCENTDGGGIENVLDEIEVGDRITCWTKNKADIGGTYTGPVYIFPTLLKYCFFNEFMPALVIVPILTLVYLVALCVKLVSAARKGESAAGRCCAASMQFVVSYSWALLFAAAAVMFVTLLLSAVLFNISKETTCKVVDKGRRVDCLLCYNNKDGTQVAASPHSWCSHNVMCGGGLTFQTSLYSAWVDVEYRLPASAHVYRVTAQSDHNKLPGKPRLSSSSSRDADEIITPYLRALPINSTIPCFVSVYGSKGKVNLAGYRPEESDSYVVAFTFMLVGPAILVLLGVCVCYRGHRCPQFCYADGWDPAAIAFDSGSGSGSSSGNSYTYIYADETTTAGGSTTADYNYDDDDDDDDDDDGYMFAAI